MTDFLGYKNKRVVVSGCFSGMGEATAKQLLSLGAEVHGLDFKETKLKLASFTKVDLRDPASIDAAAAKVGSGKVDALFNCAGLPQTAPPVDVMKVNFIGMRYLTEQLLPKMSAGSAIACIASTAGLRWSTRIPTVMALTTTDSFASAVKWCEANMETVAEGYSFSKEAVIVWTMMTAAHLIKKGIRLNCTLPGPTQTPMMKEFLSATPQSVIDAATQPINRYSTPDEQAGPLVYLNSDAATYVNGVAFPTDGGFMGAMATGQIDISAMMGGAAAA
jgi:NAD(P)-dependent dehydrogenase (short-subunit alcohol dehydrogenase family)